MSDFVAGCQAEALINVIQRTVTAFSVISDVCDMIVNAKISVANCYSKSLPSEVQSLIEWDSNKQYRMKRLESRLG